jgi:plastocyanin
MRTAVLAAVAGLALVITGASQPASTATKAVTITAAGFTPKSVTISTTDTVKWTNKDTKNHQIVANNGSFASAVIGPGRSYSHTFKAAGTYGYHDALHPALTGKVVVKGPPPAVTIGAGAPIIEFGQSTSLAGQISNGASGETVTIWAQPYGQVSPVQIATLLTTTNGAWAVPIKPTLLTTYTAHWKSTASQPVSVALRPHVAFTAYKRWGAVKVKADRSLQGKKVYLQEYTRFGQWVKTKGIILGAGSGKRFKLGLPGGHRYMLRIFMSLNQIGAGYLDGYSSNVTVKVPR